ncbi:hypothetical protein [Streptomyces sp. NPDC060031]|uniref:hypothetical protein n=1 Tax=Streptomyces sp. NPDC060031 TaxID=3347043 RepID=UPI00367D5EB2
MTESGQGNGQGNGPQPTPQAGTPWGPPDPTAEPGRSEQQQGGPAYGYPQPYPYPQAVPQPQQQPPGQQPGHVVGPGYEGPGDPHGYGYPPLPEAVTQYIPPVPAAPHEEAATQYIPPVPAAPAAPAHEEAATQYIAPVPAAPAAPAHEEAATQYIAPVPAGPGPDPAAGFDGLFRNDPPGADGHTQHLPPVQEPVLRQPQPRPYPPRGQGPVPPQQHQQYPPQFQQPPAPAPQFQPQPPQYATPQQQFQPPAPHSPRRVSPAIIAAGVIGLVVAGLGVGSLLGDGGGKPQNSDPGAVAAPPTTAKGSAAPGEAPLDPAQPQAVQLDKLLADSNDSRANVIRAVDDIKGCRNLDQAATDLRGAARQREELVTRLQELKVDKLPDNAKLTAALTKAWQASADADNSYADWADDVNHDKEKCKDGKAKSTGNASEANKSSGEATKAKDSAAAQWNAIAAKYGLTKRDKSQL